MDNFMELLPYIMVAVGAVFIISILGIAGWVHNTRMRIKHGYPLEGMWGQSLKPEMTTEAMERVKLLTQENAGLRAEMGSMKDRLAVVERIVTDKGFDVARQIDQLREGEAGVALAFDRDKTAG